MANLHRAAVFVSQITALTRKLAQYPARERKLKIDQVLGFNSILGFTQGNFMAMIDRASIFRYSVGKVPSFLNWTQIVSLLRLCDPHYKRRRCFRIAPAGDMQSLD